MDPLGYYAELGLDSTASADEIRRAFRRLAKEHHPDASGQPSSTEKFQRIVAAHAVLSNKKSRADYDASSNRSAANPFSPFGEYHARYTYDFGSWPPSGFKTGGKYDGTASSSSRDGQPTYEPVRCSQCHKEVAQPRYLIFRSVVSLIIVTITPTEGIFCSNCAAKVSLRNTLISSIFGWWGIPWGPLQTIKEVFHNASGGRRRRDLDERLQFQNTFAFAARGNKTLAASIALNLKNAKDQFIAAKAQELLEKFRADGGTPARLKSVWKPRPGRYLAHIGALLLVPGLLALIVVDSTATKPWSASSNRRGLPPATKVQTKPIGGSMVVERLPDDLPKLGDRGTTTVSRFPPVPEKRPPQPGDESLIRMANSCKRIPKNGAVLARRVKALKQGHRVTIMNGSNGDAIIKVRNAANGKLAVSFFVKNGQNATVTGIPDGSYKVQFAYGDLLREDCASFFDPIASELLAVQPLSTQRTKTHVVTRHLSYTLYTVVGGNVEQETISDAEFERD